MRKADDHPQHQDSGRASGVRLEGGLTRRQFLRLHPDAEPQHDATALASGTEPPTVYWEAAALDAAVFVAIRAAEAAGDPDIATEYALAMEPGYEAGNALSRRMQAERINALFAARLGLSDVLMTAVRRGPNLVGAVATIFVERTQNARSEEANLRDCEAGTAMVLVVRPARFADLEDLDRWLTHELAHLEDLLDPAFGRQALSWPGSTRAEQMLQRDRYRALWCLSIDARLADGGADWIDLTARRRELEQVYRHVPERLLEGAAAAVCARSPNHEELFAAALDPAKLATIAGTSLTASEQQALASARRVTCPLCRFPTTEWSSPEKWTPAMAAMVQERFADWRPASGACGNCCECYAARADGAGAAIRVGRA